MKLTTLENYVTEQTHEDVRNIFDEGWYDLILEYLGMKGYEISQEDAQYIIDNGFLLEDFETDDGDSILIRE